MQATNEYQSDGSYTNKRPRVLVSNDDGINAPGLRALVTALHEANFCDVHVCAPSGERSAQSHAITLGRYLSCYPSDVSGAVQAFAVDGTPADSVMLALNSPVFQNPQFDLVASGINRGDNCGLHVTYSGTVGAAREAACKGIPAIALSLADHGAKKQEDYLTAAQLSVPLIQSMLEVIAADSQQQQQLPQLDAFTAGYVVNVNFPSAAVGPLQGLALTHQGLGCVFPKFLEITEPKGPHMAGIDEHTPDLRVFRNYIGTARNDDTEGSDNWAVSRGWISITPLSLRQDVPARLASDTKESTSVLATVSAIIQLAAQKALLAVAKLPPAANLPSNGNKVTVTEPAGGTDQQGLPTASDVLVKPKA